MSDSGKGSPLNRLDTALSELKKREHKEDATAREIIARADWVRRLAVGDAVRLRRVRPRTERKLLRKLDAQYSQACHLRALCDTMTGVAQVHQARVAGRERETAPR